MVDPRQALQRGRRHQQDAAPQQPRARHDLDDRHGEGQRAGAGDDQHGGGDQQRAVPGKPPSSDPAEEGEQRRQVDDRRIGARHPVGEGDEARAAALGRLDQPDDLGQQRVLARGRDPHAQRRRRD